VRRPRTLALAVFTLLNVFTLAAGLTVARMLPARLARLRIPVAAARPVVNATPVLAPVEAAAAAARPAALPTASGLAAVLGRALPSAAAGTGVGIEVADARTGRVLYSDKAATPAAPASTAKLVTAVASLAVLGPQARFTTTVRQEGGTVVLVGGGDPTLAVNAYPSSDYPRPATLAKLAAATARVLKTQGRRSVRLGYDTALFDGPGMAPGWSASDITTGNVTSIVALEADQGRLTPGGALEDDDDPVNYRPRATNPAGMTAAAFASLLAQDGIAVAGSPLPAAAPASAPGMDSMGSPPMPEILE
jgi:serine-type D-Ala-D-Ala carboxypeptidase/endopeptidase (penicillin-binding protein 4)